MINIESFNNIDRSIYIRVASIVNLSSRVIYINSFYIMDNLIKYTDVKIIYIKKLYSKSIFVRDIKARLLPRLKKILTREGINNYYL